MWKLRKVATHTRFFICKLDVLVRVPTGNRWHTQNKTLQGRFVYRDTIYKEVDLGEAQRMVLTWDLVASDCYHSQAWSEDRVQLLVLGRVGCPGWTLTLWWQHCQLWTTLLGGNQGVKDSASLFSFSPDSCLGFPLAKPSRKLGANGRYRSTCEHWAHPERRKEDNQHNVHTTLSCSLSM